MYEDAIKNRHDTSLVFPLQYESAIAVVMRMLKIEKSTDRYSADNRNLHDVMILKDLVDKCPANTLLKRELSILTNSNKLARIDIRSAQEEGTILIENLSDPIAEVMSLAWINKLGKGYVIQSCSGKLDFTIKCIGQGSFTVFLMGPDVKDRKGDRIEKRVLYTSLNVDGNEMLKSAQSAWHNAPCRNSFNYDDGQSYNINICWCEPKNQV